MLEAILDFDPPIIVDKDNFNPVKLNQNIEHLLKVPIELRKKLSGFGAYIVLFNKKLTDEPEMDEKALQGVLDN